MIALKSIDFQMLYSRLYIILFLEAIFYSLFVEARECLKCPSLHPQTQFYEAEFVAKVGVKNFTKDEKGNLLYLVGVKKVFKPLHLSTNGSSEKKLWTLISNPECDWKLDLNTTYVVSGYFENKEMFLCDCGLRMAWENVTERQKQGFRKYYTEGWNAECKIRDMPLRRECTKIIGSGYEKKCFWEREPSELRECQKKYGICKVDPNYRTCSWAFSESYRNCSKVISRKSRALYIIEAPGTNVNELDPCKSSAKIYNWNGPRC